MHTLPPEDLLANAYARYQQTSARSSSLLSMLKHTNRDALFHSTHTEMYENFRIAKQENLLKQETTDEELEELAIRGATKTLQLGMQSAEVAVIVIQHAALEEYLLDLIKVIVAAKPEAVHRYLKDVQVYLLEMQEQSFDACIANAIDSWLKLQRRRSLITRWRTLFELAPPPKRLVKGPLPYDETRLQNFDNARHDAVHGVGNLVKAIDLIEEQSHHYHVASLLWIQVADVYGLKVNPIRLLFGDNWENSIGGSGGSD